MRRIEPLALLFMLLLLVGAETCFVFWLRYLPPYEPLSTPELLTMLPTSPSPPATAADIIRMTLLH